MLLELTQRWERRGLETVIRETAVLPDPTNRYVMRWFRFGNCIASLQIDAASETAWIVACRRTPTIR